MADHHLAVDVADAAVGVADDHDLLHPQLHDGHQQGTDHRAEGGVDHAAGVFDNFHIAVFQTQGGGQQLHQPGVHAGEDGDLLVGVLAGGVLLVLLFFHEFFVVSQDLVDHTAPSFIVFFLFILPVIFTPVK